VKGFIASIGLLPLWLRASTVILAGILLSVLFTGESTRRAGEQDRLAEMRAGVERSVSLLAGLVSESLVTADRATADAVIKQYVSAWPQVTFVHITDADNEFFTEWQLKPVKFGEGILKFEQPIRFGRQVFGTLALYVDLNATLASIRHRVGRDQRRAALTLMALALLIIAVVNYAAMQPVRELGRRAADLLVQRGALKAAEEGGEVERLEAALDLLQRLLQERKPPGNTPG
jgi:hypothetical protein